MNLAHAALPAPSSILAATILGRPFIVATSKESVHLLDEYTTLITSISFRDAFPHLSDQESLDGISHTAVDLHSNRIVATLNHKLAVFEPSPIGTNAAPHGWRTHSSFTALHGKVQAVDFVKDTIAVQSGTEVVVYNLQTDYALPSWKPVATLPFSPSISHLRLEVSLSNERILAVLPRGSSTCLVFDLAPTSGPDLRFSLRSRAVHSVRLKSIDWRKTSSSGSDSGPVLMTTTIQNKIHLWGCVIDEPKQFSLWITLPSPLPPPPLPPLRPSSAAAAPPVSPVPLRSNVPVHRSPLVPLDRNTRLGSNSTSETPASNDGGSKAVERPKRPRTVWSGYWKTRPSVSAEAAKNGNEDLFWSLMEDGRFYLTVVSNLDSRPPTCLTSQTTLASTSLTTTDKVPHDHLAYFRHTHLVQSRSDPCSTIHLVSRSSWSALLHTRITLSSNPSDPSSSPSSRSSISSVELVRPAINFVGHVRKLVRSFPTGENVLVVGTGTGTTTTPERKRTAAAGGSPSSSSTRVRLQSWFFSPSDDDVDDRDEEGGKSVMDLEGTDDGKKRVASWFGGKRVVVGAGNKLSVYSLGERRRRRGGGMELLAERKEDQVEFDDAKAFFVVRRTEDDPQTWIVAVTKTKKTTSASTTDKPKNEYDYRIDSWTYHSPSRRIFAGPPRRAMISTSTLASIVWVSVVPPRPGSSVINRIELESVDSEGFIQTWTLDLTVQDPTWTTEACLATGKRRVARSSSGGNGIVALASDDELSIWNEKNHEFGNTLEFSLPLEEKTISLEFSIDSHFLALASPTTVSLFAPIRRTSNSPCRWERIKTITPGSPAPITSVQFHASGLAVACREQLFFHSFSKTRPARPEDESLALTNPQLLTRMVHFGHFETVRKLLVLLARQLDEDGRTFDIKTETSQTVFGVEQVWEDLSKRKRERRKRGVEKVTRGDIVAALSTVSSFSRTDEILTASDRSRLVTALSRGDSLNGLTKDEHSELRTLVQTTFDIQSKLDTVDAFGLRYLSALRTLANGDPSSVTLVSRTTRARLAPRDVLFAYHSTSQRILLDHVIDAVGAGGKLSWDNARQFGVFSWVRSRSELVSIVELVGRTSFLLNPDERDPVFATLWYLALRKLPQVVTFWKQSLGHSDQRQMLKFLANDFDLERWRVAARKNAFALLSKRRFLFAAAFFLLGDSLSDCVSVILRHVQDPALAVAVARTYEVEDCGPVLRDLLERTVLPDALRDGDRFTASWAFEMLGDRVLSKRVLSESLDLIESSPARPDEVVVKNNPSIEDPTRIVFFQQLEETDSTTTTTTPSTGRFILYTARQLCEAGCHLVALDLVESYRFRQTRPRPRPGPPRPTTLYKTVTTTNADKDEDGERNGDLALDDDDKARKDPRKVTNFVEPDSASLFDMMSRPAPPLSVPSIAREEEKEVEAVVVVDKEKRDDDHEEVESESERQKRLFREATGAKPKVETKSTVEAFSFDAFGF